MNEKIPIPHEAASCGIGNFSFIVSERDFSCSTNIPCGLSAYKPYKLVVYCFYINNSEDVRFFHEFPFTINRIAD